MRQHPWSVLGITPTDDRREIRLAYSRLLKAIDVEADPGAFVTLREAFELATAIATGDVAPTAEGEALPLDPRRDALAALQDELATTWRPVDDDRLLDAAAILLAPEALDQLDASVETENAILAAILPAGPRADILLDPAVRAFRWHEEERPPRAIRYIVEQWRRTRFPTRRPEHARAYAALVAPFTPPGRWREKRLASAIHRLFVFADARQPRLWNELDPAAVTWWRERHWRPRLGALHLIEAVLIGFANGAVLNSYYTMDKGDSLLAWLASVPVALILISARLHYLAWWGPSPGLSRPPGLVAGALLVAACALPLVPFVVPLDTSGFIALALVAGLVAVFIDPSEPQVSNEQTVGGPLIACGLWCAMGAYGRVPAYLIGAIPMAVAAMAVWASFPRFETRRPSQIANGVLLLGAAAIGIVLLDSAEGGARGIGMVALPMLVLAQHLVNGHAVVVTITRAGFWLAMVAATMLAWNLVIPKLGMPEGPNPMPALFGFIIATAIAYRAIRVLLMPEHERI